MLKLLPPKVETFHNVKCGEIFCTTAAVFNVTCCLCGSTMHMDQFVCHFQAQHLSLAEQTINLEVLEKKCAVNLALDLGLVEYDIMKETEPDVDPIKEEQDFEGPVEGISYTKEQIQSTSDIEEDEDNKCLQEWFLAAKAKQKTLNLKNNANNKLSSSKVKGSGFFAKDEQNKDPIQEEKLGEKTETGNKNNPDYIDLDASDKDFKTISDMQWSSDEEDTEENIELAEKPEGVLPKNLDKNYEKSKSKHKCDECGEVFSSARNLSGHKWKHTGIYCDICGKQFTQVGNMTRHKIRQCKERTKEFFTAKELRLHMVCHSKLMPVTAHIQSKHLPSANESTLYTTIEEQDLTDFAVKGGQELESTMKSIIISEKAKALLCHTEEDDDEICLLDLFRRVKLRRKKHKHSAAIKSSTDSIVNPGKQSSKKTKKNKQLAKPEKIELLLPTTVHENEADDAAPDNTDTVYNDFGQSQDITEIEDFTDNQHSVSNDEVYSGDELPFPCLLCKRHFPTNESLRRHENRLHNPSKPPVRKRRASKKPKHKCPECGKEFRCARDLQGHKWEHTGIFCDICGKIFSQVGNMVRHRIRHTGKKDFKCTECNKEFFTLKELQSHMICHTGLMPWICEICGKPCRDRGVLSAHMRRHTGERPAKCDVCGKCFFSFHDLNVHLVTHTSERPFECDICASAFRSKKALRVHKLTHATDREHVCKICGKCFLRQSGLNTHLRTHNAGLLNSLGSPQNEPQLGLLLDKLITNKNVS